MYDFLASAAARYGVGFWKPGSGIIHQVSENHPLSYITVLTSLTNVMKLGILVGSEFKLHHLAYNAYIIACSCCGQIIGAITYKTCISLSAL